MREVALDGARDVTLGKGAKTRARTGILARLSCVSPPAPELKTGYEVTWFDPKGVLQTAVLTEELLKPFVDELEPSI